MKHYTYITTNLINGKQYVGDHSTDNLNDEYLGSGLLITKAIKKYKRENFERKILEHFDTKQEAFAAQEKYINSYNTLVPKGYNISPCGGIGVTNCYITEEHREILKRPKSEEHKRKISESHIGIKPSEESKEKNRKSHLGKTHSQKTIEFFKKSRKKEKNGMFGKKHSAESIEKMKIAKSDISLETRNKMSVSKKGIKLSKEHKRKLSLAKFNKPHPQKKIKCEYCGVETTATNIKRWHGDNCKNKK